MTSKLKTWKKRNIPKSVQKNNTMDHASNVKKSRNCTLFKVIAEYNSKVSTTLIMSNQTER